MSATRNALVRRRVPASRDPRLAEALARLEVAARQRDPVAAARIIDSLLDTSEDGRWIVTQFAAAALRTWADAVAEGSGGSR